MVSFPIGVRNWRIGASSITAQRFVNQGLKHNNCLREEIDAGLCREDVANRLECAAH